MRTKSTEKALYQIINPQNFVVYITFNMQSLVLHTERREQFKAIKDLLKSLKIKHEEYPCNPEFVARIDEGRQQAREGKLIRIKTEDLWE